MINALLLAALLAIADPVGDTAGDGSLRPPTSGIYAGTASFDLLDVSLLDTPNLTLSITLGALGNPAELVNGFSHPIVEIYLDSAAGGELDLLPGSAMTLPDSHGWETALRITGDTVEVHHHPATGDRVRMAAEIRIEQGAIVVATPLPTPVLEDITLFAIVGVYDPFAPDGWRPIARTPSPWAFSSDEQIFPVIDMLASTDEAQTEALQSGVLPLNSNPTAPDAGVPWLLMMGFGVLVAVVGVGLRSRVSGIDREVTAGAPSVAANPVVASTASAARGDAGSATAVVSDDGNGAADEIAIGAPTEPPGLGVGDLPIIIGREGRTGRRPLARPKPPHTAIAPLSKPIVGQRESVAPKQLTSKRDSGPGTGEMAATTNVVEQLPPLEAGSQGATHDDSPHEGLRSGAAEAKSQGTTEDDSPHEGLRTSAPEPAAPPRPPDAGGPDGEAGGNALAADAPSADTSPGNAPPGNTVPRDTVSRDAVPRDAVPRDAVSRDAVSRDAVSSDIGAGDEIPSIDELQRAAGRNSDFDDPDWDADEVLGEPGDGRWSAAWRKTGEDEDTS